jgi:hypothetical protein
VVNGGDEGERRDRRSWDARVGDRFAFAVISLALHEGDAAEVVFGGDGELDVRAFAPAACGAESGRAALAVPVVMAARSAAVVWR